jgi:hypothetical protein
VIFLNGSCKFGSPIKDRHMSKNGPYKNSINNIRMEEFHVNWEKHALYQRVRDLTAKY